MEKYTIKELEDCIYANKTDKLWRRNWKKVNILSFTQIDDDYVVVETDEEPRLSNDKLMTFRTCNMKNRDTISWISGNRDKQILITLWLKYDWLNSQFAHYADRMLWITVDLTDK